MSKEELGIWAYSLITISLGGLLFICSCNPPEEKPLPKIIIDADTANEVDDLYALVRAILEPSIELLGITSAQFHTSPLASDSTVLESQEINEQIAALLGATDLPLRMGSNEALNRPDEGRDRPAARFIVDQARSLSAGDFIHVIILGSCTNVASAILLAPDIVPKLKVHYLGFWHDPSTNTYDKKEFNSGNDTLAVDVLLNTPGLSFDVMTATSGGDRFSGVENLKQT